MSKGELVITDRRPQYGEGSTGLAIKNAQSKADAVLDTQSNALKDDSIFMPLGDRVTVKRIAEAELTSHGLHLPDSGKTPPAFGVVVGVGQGRYNLVGQLIPSRLQNGAVVMFGKYAGTDLPLFGVGGRECSLLCLREEEIMGVIMSKEQAALVMENADPEITGVAR